MSLNENFPADQKQPLKQMTVCVAVKRDEEEGLQVAVIQNGGANQNDTVLPVMKGDPRQESYMKTIHAAILGPLGVTSVKPVKLNTCEKTNTSCVAFIGEVSAKSETPEHYTFIPLTGAFNQITYPQMREAIIATCTDMNVPLTNGRGGQRTRVIS